MESPITRARAALALLSVLLASGIVMAGRLVQHHEVQLYGDASAALSNCPQSETINCEAVNTSPWSELLGIPIAAFAIPTYLLVLGLVLPGPGRDASLRYAFSIGILATLYSGFLLWVSSTQIGYLCLWCMGLYGINIAIPVLIGVAVWRSPGRLIHRTLQDLASWPKTLRWTAAWFVILLMGTIAVQQSYRSEVRREAARERVRIEEEGGPLLPAVPPGSASPDETPAPDRTGDDAPAGSPNARRMGASSPIRLASLLPLQVSLASPAAPAPSAPPSAGAPQPGKPYRLAGPLRRVSGSSPSEPFDLQGRLGRGRPVALVFWAPGFPDAERELVKMASFLKRQTPQFEVYAVSGRRDDQQEAEIWERFVMLDVPPDLPILIDDRFVVSEALTTVDVPDLAVFDGKGSLVVAKIKDLSQQLMSSAGRVPAEGILRKVASGAPVEQIKSMFPYYPSADLMGGCAPAFTAKKLGSNDTYTFSGRSPSGKPTLLMFWSSTCTHCQQEIPQLVDWMNKHPGVVDLVSVTHLKRKDGSDAAHRKITENYIRAEHIPWVVLEDPDNAIAELYRSISTPTTYIVSPSSKIVDIWYYAHGGNFPQALQTSLAKAASQAACEAPLSVPAARLAFSMMAPDGKRLPLASLLDRPAIVHFWATWCAPCVEELPSLVRFRERIEKEGTARVVLVSVEGEEAGKRIADFQKTMHLDLRSYRAPSGDLALKVDLARRVPRTYLVAPGGDVLALRQGSQNWDDPSLVERVRSRLTVLGHQIRAAGVKPGAAPKPAR